MNKFILRLNYAVILTTLAIMGLFFAISAVHAEELVISGNGSGSDSQIQVSLNATTTVEQSNQANVVNDVGVSANTGDNTASSNTASQTAINTGNINSDTSIQNSVNTSNVNLNCCPNEPNANVNISGNGSSSDNSVSLNQNQNTQINVNQNAYINNTVNGSANTGLNNANDNTHGDVSIATGNIDVKDDVKNHGINNSNVSAPQGGSDLQIKISGNGSDSNSSVNLSISNNLKINVNNYSDIQNSNSWDLNTGGNHADGNSGGSVTISTGDINLNTKIENGPINISRVNVRCCNGSNNPQSPNDPGNPAGGPIQSSLPPSSSTSSSGDNHSSNLGSDDSSEGSVLAQAAQAAGQILPQTGSFWTILLTLASLMMFVLGLYLRQHPGRDPSLRYVYA